MKIGWLSAMDRVRRTCALLATAGISLASFYTAPRYPEQDYRPLAARIDALARPADRIVAYTTKPGDNLWKIAVDHCGSASLVNKIREEFGFIGTPIRVQVRRRSKN